MLYRQLKKDFNKTRFVFLTGHSNKNISGVNRSLQLETRRFFAREPIRSLGICLNTIKEFLCNNRQNRFNMRKFDLEHIYVSRNGLPVADSPISTSDDKLPYFNTISVFVYIDTDHGIGLTE